MPDEYMDPSNVFEGVPLVRMYDKADDVRDLLRFFYHAPTFTLTRYDPETPKKVGGILRLAKKYQIASLWDRLVKQIETDWPQTLSGWDRLEGEINLWNQHCVEEGESRIPCSDIVFPEPGSAAQLAREFDLRKITPAVFYHLSRLEISRNRGHLYDKQVADRIAEVRSLGGRTANWSLLTLPDLKCLLLGRERIQQYLEKEFTRFRNSPQFHYCDPQCNRKSFEDGLRVLIHSSDILSDLKILVSEDLDNCGTETLCSPCQEKAKATVRQLRTEIWDRLAEFFELPVLSDNEDDDGDGDEDEGDDEYHDSE
ncbi:hypothetical protein CONPUDRAFT_167721 [Coniophora puteana RWD-64-598 SS2]|uniref:BTB domain-containing protein n=1 Tax=Coniophora puteana (strain RWD-64-598) TaxID=741705 RepID=A0A5M3ME89_CONPW|nr:uncharacterized protein CONPUDRAFT_167721 [Coniophora puteana RWD-64-598 SS2]EIW77589.1 hypothetical protein CONPUDRAFT_167721 [Coniophora puteana RWD-64-598 SS2]